MHFWMIIFCLSFILGKCSISELSPKIAGKTSIIELSPKISKKKFAPLCVLTFAKNSHIELSPKSPQKSSRKPQGGAHTGGIQVIIDHGGWIS